MTSKKTYAIILTALISLSTISPVYADEARKIAAPATSSSAIATSADESTSKISKDQAINIAKKVLKDYFEVNIDDTKYQVNINYTPDYMYNGNTKAYVWQINWYFHDQEKDINVNVSLESATGNVQNVDVYNSKPGQAPGIATLTEDQAKEVADKFLKTINPEEYAQSKYIKNDGVYSVYKGNPMNYNFSYYRIVNDLPFANNFLSVAVDNVTGKVRSYTYRWNNYQIPSKDNVISQENANKIFKDNTNLELKYVPFRDDYGYNTKNTKVAYMPGSFNPVNIDATDGKILDYDNTSNIERKVIDLNEDQKKDFINNYKPIQKLDKELTNTSAETIMKSLVKEVYGDGYEIDSTNYQENNGAYSTGVPSWYGHFIKKGAEERFSDQGQVSIDASTGQLMSITKYNPKDEFNISNTAKSSLKLTEEQAYAKAIDIMKKYYPDKVKEIETKQYCIKNLAEKGDNFTRYFGVNFPRLINGVAYQDDAINIGFNLITGDLNNIDCRWTQGLNVQPTTGVISKDTATDLFFKTYKPQLQYTIYNKSKDNNNADYGVKLVYSLLGLENRQINGIDAVKGKFIDFNGQEINNDMESFKLKIKGSAVEKELNILASQGIIETKDFDLNKQVTRADLVKILVNAKGYRPYMLESAPSLKINYSGSKTDETYKYLQMAVSYGVLDNSGDFKGDEKVTKEEAIKDIIKLLGYDKLAQAKGIFTVSYTDASDITPENLGYVAISKGLGLTNDTDSKFKPKENVTMSDLAYTIYRALGSLRNTGY